MLEACCIYRIDDVTPGMDWDKFTRFLDLFGQYGVVPLLGVVPENRDPNLVVGKREKRFWSIMRMLKDEGRVEISQHGYRHVYITDRINTFYRICGFTRQSEFCGLDYWKQYMMIKRGRDIFRRHGIDVDIWMAPAHSFDRNTERALKKLGFKAVTDGIGLFPVKRNGIVFIPQQVWEPESSSIGVKTICLHLNNANDRLFQKVRRHLQSGDRIVSFSSVADGEIPPWGEAVNAAYRVMFLLHTAKGGLRRMVRQASNNG